MVRRTTCKPCSRKGLSPWFRFAIWHSKRCQLTNAKRTIRRDSVNGWPKTNSAHGFLPSCAKVTHSLLACVCRKQSRTWSGSRTEPWAGLYAGLYVGTDAADGNHSKSEKTIQQFVYRNVSDAVTLPKKERYTGQSYTTEQLT
jgi:hypothetical protein